MNPTEFLFLGTFENQKNVGIGRDAEFFKESACSYFESFEVIPSVKVTSKRRRIANLVALTIRELGFLLRRKNPKKKYSKIVFHPQIPTTRTPRFPITNTIQIVRIHDLFPITNPEWFPKGVKFLFRIQLFFLNSAKAIFVCNSEYTQSQLQKIIKLKNKSYVIRCPINVPNRNDMCEVCEICLDSQILGSRFAFSLGTLEPRKNFDFISKIWPEISRQTDAKLVIAGKRGWKVPTIFNTNTSVVYLGKVCDGALFKLYSSASLYIAPSKAEGFDIPFHEAQEFRLPVLASDIPVHRIKNVTLFRATDPFEFQTKAIQLLLGDDRPRGHFVSNDSSALRKIWESICINSNGELN
jgi:glycosyltransferase involved in cell wall biosynthesis